MCEYCNEYCERKFLSERELSQIDYKTYTGLQMEVNPMDKELNVYCVLENKNIRPVSEEFNVSIKYCPMCGKKL